MYFMLHCPGCTAQSPEVPVTQGQSSAGFGGTLQNSPWVGCLGGHEVVIVVVVVVVVLVVVVEEVVEVELACVAMSKSKV